MNLSRVSRMQVRLGIISHLANSVWFSICSSSRLMTSSGSSVPMMSCSSTRLTTRKCLWLVVAMLVAAGSSSSAWQHSSCRYFLSSDSRPSVRRSSSHSPASEPEEKSSDISSLWNFRSSFKLGDLSTWTSLLTSRSSVMFSAATELRSARERCEVLLVSCLTRYSSGMAAARSSQLLLTSAALLLSDSSTACSVISCSPGLSSRSPLSSFSQESSSSLISTLMAACSEAFSPPSAMRLETRRSVMNLRPEGSWAASGWCGSRWDRARALSSGVGSSTVQPASSSLWAAACTVSSTPGLLASSTTFFLRLSRRGEPGPRPREARPVWCWITDNSCSRRRLRAAVARHSCSWLGGQSLLPSSPSHTSVSSWSINLNMLYYRSINQE